MKKKTFIIAILAVALVVIVSFTTWYFSTKTFLKGIDADDVISISVFDGSTGETYTIEDDGEIEYIISNLQSIKWHRSGISSFHDGYSFSLKFNGKDGKEIDNLILNNQYLIRDDPFFYNNTDTPACYEYLQALENKYTDFPECSENTTLDFWITENVSNTDLTSYQFVYHPSALGFEKEKVFFGKEYTSLLDSAENEIIPEHYVMYAIAPYPYNSTSGDEYIVAIEITDPTVYLYGLTVDCTTDEFFKTFQQLGFEVHTHSEYDSNHYAIKDGIVIIFEKSQTRAVFSISVARTFEE